MSKPCSFRIHKRPTGRLWIVFFCLSILLPSCKRQNDNLFMSGAEVRISQTPGRAITITPSAVIKNEATVGMTGLLEVIDTVLVVCIKDSNYYLRALGTETCQKLCDFAMLGRGPGEDSYFIRSQKKDGATKVIDMLGGQSKDLLSIDLGQTLKEKDIQIIETSHLPQYTFNAYDLGDTLLANVYFDEDLISFKYFNRKNVGTPERVIQLFGAEDYLIDMQPLFNSMQRLKPDGSQLAMAMAFFDKINILDIHSANHFSITTNPDIESDGIVIDKYIKITATDGFGKWRAYLDVDISDERIYALHLCADIDGSIPPSIQVFNWEGEYLTEYQIGEPISRIVYNDSDNTIYGYCFAEECIYVYKLDEDNNQIM